MLENVKTTKNMQAGNKSNIPEDVKQDKWAGEARNEDM